MGRSRSSKVVDFVTNRKGVWDFLLVINSNFAAILHCFWDTATYWHENCEFCLPHSHLTPSLRVNPFDFLDELYIRKTRVLGLSVSEDFVFLAWVVLTHVIAAELLKALGLRWKEELFSICKEIYTSGEQPPEWPRKCFGKITPQRKGLYLPFFVMNTTHWFCRCCFTEFHECVNQWPH